MDLICQSGAEIVEVIWFEVIMVGKIFSKILTIYFLYGS